MSADTLEPEMSPEELDAAIEAHRTAEAQGLSEALDDDGAEHRAYQRGLAEGRGAVVVHLRSIIAVSRGPLRSVAAELIKLIEEDGADPAGYERGRAEGVRDAALMLRKYNEHDSAVTIDRHEAELLAARERERAGR